jgi:hypothetical protein
LVARGLSYHMTWLTPRRGQGFIFRTRARSANSSSGCHPDGKNSTVLDINLTFTLQGMLAQFSRPAGGKDFASFIIEEFGEKLSRRLQS